MKKARLSREQTRQQTRQRLLDAAANVIVRNGYAGSSVEEIAAEAGYSRGAFYSNFGNKDELFATLIEQLCADEQAQLAAIFARGGNGETMRAQLRAFYADHFRQGNPVMLYIEAKIHATRDIAFRRRLVAVERATRERITGFVARYCEQYHLPWPATAHEQLACGLMALADGITFARMLDPEALDEAKAGAVLSTFFDAVITPHAAIDKTPTAAPAAS